MATTDEIRRRVEEADIARSAKRSAAAQQVGDYAQRRAAIAEQLEDIERQLGDILATASEVMSLDELARFTDIPAADLTRWLEARKAIRTRRRRPAGFAVDAKRDAPQGPSRARTPARTSTSNRTSTPPATTTPQVAAPDTPPRASAEAT